MIIINKYFIIINIYLFLSKFDLFDYNNKVLSKVSFERYSKILISIEIKKFKN
jgi:hypothetical protein